MLLAAGRGERMRELTADRPKPLLEVGGAPLIGRLLRALSAAGIRDVVVNLSYRGDQIRSALGQGRGWGVRIDYSPEPEPPLETAGGIVNALPLLGSEPFILVNADVLTDFDFTLLAAGRGRGTLVLVPNPPHNAAGDFAVATDARVSAEGAKLTFAGISLLDPALFAGLAPGRRPLKPVLDAAIARGELYALRHRGLWLDVGTPERLSAADALLSRPGRAKRTGA